MYFSLRCWPVLFKISSLYSWRPLRSKQVKQSTHVLSWDQETLERPPFVRWDTSIENCFFEQILSRDSLAEGTRPLQKSLPPSFHEPLWTVSPSMDSPSIWSLLTLTSPLLPMASRHCRLIFYLNPKSKRISLLLPIPTRSTTSVNTPFFQTGCDVICLVYDSSNPRYDRLGSVNLQIPFRSGALNTVRGSTFDISPPHNCQCWWLPTKVTRGWWGRITYCRFALDSLCGWDIQPMTNNVIILVLNNVSSHCSLRRSVPSTSYRHLKKPLLALFLPKISSSNLQQWPPSREYFNPF